MMKMKMSIAVGMALCFSLYGKTTADKKPEVLPVEVEKHKDAIKDAMKTNGVVTAQRAYDQIDWQAVKHPAKVLKDISKDVEKSKDAEALRREIKTKYELLREVDDLDLTDPVKATPIPVVTFPVQRFPAIEIGQLELVVMEAVTLDVPELVYAVLGERTSFNTILVPTMRYTYLDILTCDPEAMRIVGIVTPMVYGKPTEVVVVRIGNKKFDALMNVWERRYNRTVDYFDAKGHRLVPAAGTVLWVERKALLEATEAGTVTDAQWDAYNQRFNAAIGRRVRLKRQR